MVDEKSLLILSLTPVSSEPRVLRQIQVLKDKTWSVTIAGFQGKNPIPKYWNFLELPYISRFSYAHYNQEWRKVWAKIKDTLRLDQTLQIIPGTAEWCLWQQPIYHLLLKTFGNRRFDCVLCHDYYTLPLAFHLLKKGGSVIADLHEHALSQDQSDNFWKNLRYRFWKRPYIHAIQKKYLPRTKALITVCDGIAKELEKTYPQAPKPVVVRNVPFYTKQAFRGVDPTCLKLLYSGALCEGRGLELLLHTATYIQRPVHITLKGPGKTAYLEKLQGLARNMKLNKKISIEPPTPFHDIVSDANTFDVGFFVQPALSAQKLYTLPNKFFEYIMAGLALCVADLPEMAKIVKAHDLGLLVPFDPQEIARRLDALTPAKINQHKKNALKAAQDLCWEQEKQNLERALGESV